MPRFGVVKIRHPDDQETLWRAQIRGCPFDSARILVDPVFLVGSSRKTALSASCYPVSFEVIEVSLGENGKDHHFDPLLHVLCKSSIRDSLPFRVALTVGGHLVTGNFATMPEFVHGIEDYFGAVGSEFTVFFSQALRELADVVTAELEEVDDDDPDTANVVFLSDVVIEGSYGSKQIPWWSVRVSAISGWWFVPYPPDPPLPDNLEKLALQ